MKPPEAFNFEEPNAPQRWSRWEKQFQTYFTAAELSAKTAEVQVARLLNAAGPEAQEVHELFTYANDDEKKDYKAVLKKFSEYCRPKKNLIYVRYKFWHHEQKEGEAFDHWVKDLHMIAKDCEFTEEDNMIRDKVVFGINDKKVQERMLRKSDLTLTEAKEYCRAAESSQSQLSEMRKDERAGINEMKGGVASGVQCFYCNESGHIATNCPQKEEDQKQKQYKCYNCQKQGHRSFECPEGDSYPQRKKKNSQRGRGRGRGRARRGRSFPSREVHEMEEGVAEEYAQEFSSLSLSTLSVTAESESESGPEVLAEGPSQEDEVVEMEKRSPTPKTLCINSLGESTKKRFVKFRMYDLLHGKSSLVEMKIDSGAEANVMPLKRYKELYPDRVGEDGLPLPRYIRSSSKKLEAYGGIEVPQLGTVNLPCQYNGKKFMCRFFVCDIEGSMLVGLPTCEALGIVKITVVNEVAESENEAREGSSDQVATGNSSKEGYIDPNVPIEDRPVINGKEDLKKMYPECFEIEGKHFLDFEYSIKVDQSVLPKANPPRRIPLEVKEKLLAKLKEMEERGVIVKVTEATEWVNSLVVETKPNGDIRVCLDPTDLNKAVRREYHPIPVIDDIVPELKGSTLFSKLDLKDGYWHIKLTEDSSFLTTFSTPFGKFRFTRLPFGLRVSQDIFQYKVDETYGPCEGAIGISDDITLHGEGEVQHDRRLHAAMEQTRKSNLCLNYEKLLIKQKSVKFFGNIYSAEGVTADPQKVAAIADMRPPESKSEVKSFLGMVNYLQRFIPRLSEHTKLLRDLERRGVHFVWGEDHQEAFEKVKSLVTESMLLAYYDRKKPVTLQCDYSENGIGVALVQDGKPVQFTRKALVDGEENFAPIEGEMLGVVYGIKKFHHYLYGRRFLVECDHKPLHHIHKKNLSLAPPRLRGMLRAVADYDYTLQHRPGREMVLPDALSRLSRSDKKVVPGTRVRVHELVDVSQSRLKRLQVETESDEVLQKIKTYVVSGWPASIKSLEPEIRPYWGIHNDISIVDGLVMAGSRIIIPSSSRTEVLREIHQGHQGETKCMLRAKSAVYWPGIYKDIQNVVGNCGACREVENAQTKCPMIVTEIPAQPWHTVGVDLFQQKSKWYILVTDVYSKAPFVRPLANTGAYASIRALKEIFSENGIPVSMISDNGSHFTAGEFKRFASEWGFEMILSSPEYPQGHALIERHIQTIKKCMSKCDISGYDFDLALLVLRSTPLGTNLPSPAELLQQRKFRTTLPTFVANPPNSKDVQEKLKERQSASAERYDRAARPKPELVEGQPVRLRNKDTRRWEPAVITGRAPTPRSYIVQRLAGGMPLRRNRVQIRTTRENFTDDIPSRSDDEEEEEEVGPPTTNNVVEGPVGSAPTGGAGALPSCSPPVLRRSDRQRKQTQFFQSG